MPVAQPQLQVAEQIAVPQERLLGNPPAQREGGENGELVLIRKARRPIRPDGSCEQVLVFEGVVHPAQIRVELVGRTTAANVVTAVTVAALQQVGRGGVGQKTDRGSTYTVIVVLFQCGPAQNRQLVNAVKGMVVGGKKLTDPVGVFPRINAADPARRQSLLGGGAVVGVLAVVGDVGPQAQRGCPAFQQRVVRRQGTEDPVVDVFLIEAFEEGQRVFQRDQRVELVPPVLVLLGRDGGVELQGRVDGATVFVAPIGRQDIRGRRAVGVQVKRDFELVRRVHLVVEANVVFLQARGQHHAVLIEVIEAQIVIGLVRAARERQLVVLRQGGAENLVLPVGTVADGADLVGRELGRFALIRRQVVQYFHVLIGAEQTHPFGNRLHAHICAVIDLWRTGFSFFGGNKYHAIGRPRAVNGRRRGIF